MQRLLSVITVVGISLGAIPVWSDEYVCRAGKDVRTISVEREVEGQAVPCVVKYAKPAQGVTEFPYNAKHDQNYCPAKADELAIRLGTLGWQCERQDSAEGKEDS
jgi:hypothetical protein